MSRHSRTPKIRIEGAGLNHPSYAIGWGAHGYIVQPIEIEARVNGEVLAHRTEFTWTITILHEDET